MKNIFTGFIFIFLNFNLNLGNSQISLIPDFVGYILMIKGLDEMVGESMFFVKVKPYATGMTIYSSVLYVMDLLGISVSLGGLVYVLAIVSTTVSLIISYNIVMGVIDLEKKYNISLNGDSLKSSWMLLAVFNVLTYVLFMIPMIAMLTIIASFIIAIYFLFAFNNSKNMYYGSVR